MFSTRMENVARLDFCWIGREGDLVGSSTNADVVIEGEIDNEGTTILDFSVVRKTVKETLEGFFNHKIVFYEKISNGNYFFENDKYIIKTPLNYLECPKDLFSFIPYENQFFSKNITEKINEKFNSNFKCTVHFKEFENPNNYFSYIHLLKNLGFPDESKIADYLKEKFIVNKENAKNSAKKEVEIEYQTECGRIYVKVNYPKKWIIFSKDSTFGDIIKYISENFDDYKETSLEVDVKEMEDFWLLKYNKN